MNKNSKVAELIIRAQNASDGGKNINALRYSHKSVTDNRAGYGNKDIMIMSAIKIICSGHTDWKYAVKADYDQNGYSCFIVYFQTIIDREKVQISFHTFNIELKKFVRNSFRIKWDHGNSRESAIFAYRHYVPNGEYC